MTRLPTVLVLALAVPAQASQSVPDDGVRSTATAPFPNFESGQVRPLLLSKEGTELYALNTPDHRVEVYATGADGPGQMLGGMRYAGAVFTGLEPVSMALHPDVGGRLFVANCVSDTVSVVDLAGRKVEATVQVGDEPQDVVVAGGKVFVACARSFPDAGLVDPGDAVENTVVVFEAAPPYAVLARVEIPAHKPRALAVAGRTVYVIPQNSGNHTTTISQEHADGMGLVQTDLDAFDPAPGEFEMNGALLADGFDDPTFISSFGVNGWQVPVVGRIVMDDEFPALTPALPDNDVVGIDVLTHELLASPTTGVATTLLGIARNPLTGDLWIVGTDAKNRTRFEPRIRGDAFENRVVVATPGGAVQQIIRLAPPLTQAEHAQPSSIAFYSGELGTIAYVGALGTATVVALDGATGALVAEIRTGLLPTGLAVDSERGLLYVLSRADQAVQVFDLAAGHAPLGLPTSLAYDPEPKIVKAGRTQLYDAREATGAGTGNFSCASCHVFGHMDQLAWDLGDPGGGLGYFFPDLLTGPVSFDNQTAARRTVMQTHPMKGPMTTQSLRGLSPEGSKPLHWRGDRRFFQMFRGAFRGLLGGSGISERSMQEYAGFIEGVVFAPNPFQPKDRVYAGDEAAGFDVYGMNPEHPGVEYNEGVPGDLRCISCHVGNFTDKTDFTGARATVNFDGESQLFNTAQLRGVYEKEFRHLTGYGTLHDGTVDGLMGFLTGSLMGIEAFPDLSPQEKQQVFDFVTAWDTGLAPLVGGQHTAGADAAADQAWLALARGQAEPPASNVDLIAKGIVQTGSGPFAIGLHYAEESPGTWAWETSHGTWLSDEDLVTGIGRGELCLTFTCVPPGTGRRLGVDRDEDGLADHAEDRYRTSATDPDTDRDGYSDAAEVLAGTPPFLPTEHIGDRVAPTVSGAQVRALFSTSATLHFQVDEPARALVELGSAAGSYDLASFNDKGLRRVHDVVVDHLPPGTTVFYRITARDRNGNAGQHEGSFLVPPPLYHLRQVTLAAAGAAPYTLTATAAVVDQYGEPVVDIPVKGIWAGDVGGAEFYPTVRTDAQGVATFQLGPYTPSGPTTVYFSVAFVGALNAQDPFYLGRGGDTPTFFYNASANVESYASVDLP